MRRERIALISTVLNEASCLGQFLQAIDRQTIQPDEIVIVDGGSVDGTLELLKRAAGERTGMKIIVETGCSIARGRNVAIAGATAGIIAVTDAGATPDPSWLSEITAPFAGPAGAEVVGGWYEPAPETPFERRVAALHVPLQSIDPHRFLPSARSLAFRRGCWKRIGGFPEHLTNWGEDTLFALRLKETGCTIHFAPQAIVRWRPRPNLRSFARQFFNYGRGDGEAHLDTQLNLKRLLFILGLLAIIPGILVSAVLAAAGAVLFAAGLYRILTPLRARIPSLSGLPALIPLIVIRESAQVAGYLAGRLSFRKEPA